MADGFGAAANPGRAVAASGQVPGYATIVRNRMRGMGHEPLDRAR